MTMSYRQQLEAEADTWCIEDANARHEKVQRERIRHHRLIRDLLLDRLDTHLMDVLEVGGGPVPVSDLLQFKNRLVIDPLTEAYREYFPCPHHSAQKIEEVELGSIFDLVISTNALDHVEDPCAAIRVMADILRPGGFLAVMCAENNALTNPHPCHVHNLTADFVHRILDPEFETVWELTFDKDRYRYGWQEYQGKRGQPAFALLMRKCVGY